MALKNSKLTFKHETLTEMRDKGELDVTIYDKIKTDMQKLVKKPVEAKTFPAQAEEIKYPEPALKIGNPLYQTSNMGYGQFRPSKVDMPTKYYPRPPEFQATFHGGQYVEGSLITVPTPSRVHKSLDM